MSIYLLTLKALHVIFMVTWFAGLFYLPRLYVYHATSSDEISLERFKVMERKLFWGIMTPSAVLALTFGITLWLYYNYYGGCFTPRSRSPHCWWSITSGAASS